MYDDQWRFSKAISFELLSIIVSTKKKVKFDMRLHVCLRQTIAIFFFYISGSVPNNYFSVLNYYLMHAIVQLTLIVDVPKSNITLWLYVL